MKNMAKKARGRGRPKKKDRSVDTENARSKLIEVGKRLFASSGYDGTTVKELCDEAELNVSLISYYFNGKEGLYRAVLDKFGESRLSTVVRVLQAPKTEEELKLRLSMFATDLLDGFVDEPDLTTVVFRETENPHEFIDDIFRERFLKLYDTIIEFLESAQKAKLIRKDVEPNLAAGLLFGSITHFFRMSRTAEQYGRRTIANEAFRKSVVEHILSVFLEGLLETTAT